MSIREGLRMNMLQLAETPHVYLETALVGDALREMNRHGLGICCLISKDMKLVGCFTDGDLRRLISNQQKPFAALIMDDLSDYSTPNPLCITEEDDEGQILMVMAENRVSDLPVVTSDRTLIGLANIHNVLREQDSEVIYRN